MPGLMSISLPGEQPAGQLRRWDEGTRLAESAGFSHSIPRRCSAWRSSAGYTPLHTTCCAPPGSQPRDYWC
jgi:hypothetical protein